MTRPYAEVIGDPIAQSKSPLIHNFWLQKLGIDAEYRASQVRIDYVQTYFAERRADPAWRGCNVTMPLKQVIAPFVQTVDEFAGRAGAINTVLRQGNGLRGANSDGRGFLEPLGPLTRDADGFTGHARLIGTGGAARAIAVALQDAGFELTIHGRSLDRVNELITAIGGGPESRAALLSEPMIWEQRHQISLLINATSLGMTGHPPLPISLDQVDAQVAVYDIVTSPPRTPLLAEARARGMRTFDGLQMLVAQAAIAFEQFFGQPAPREHDPDLRERLLA